MIEAKPQSIKKAKLSGNDPANPSAMGDANSQIFAGLIGLIVILGSWLLLTTINPQLININPQLKGSGLVVGETPGIYLCKNDGELTAENCDGPYNSDKNSIPSDFYNKINYVRFENPEGVTYGVVLHEDKYLKGECEVVLSNPGSSTKPVQKINDQGGVSSISVFRRPDQVSGAGVTLYDGREYQDKKWGHIGPYVSEVIYNDINDAKQKFDGEASSVKIDGTYMALLFKDKNLSGNCLALKGSDPSLSNEGFDNNVKSFQVLFAQ